ncbi:UDP-glucuronosyl/UDP-glucosyltransferase [Trema orientale]|uniref:Glycosyltransferase n=1 Tax=Trema orientale TaxID=63057 RepID=A0A2P5BZ14_TREOI|nr:UDP-glucuronosyl/UDP-glucosyltransferase [Trema orientale]
MVEKSHFQNEVVFISTPAIGMLTPTVEFARRVVNHHSGRLSATVLLIPVPQWPTIHSYTQSLPATSSHNLRFHLLPTMHPPSPDHFNSYVAHISSLIEQHKPNVKNAIVSSNESDSESGRRFIGLFVDMFCTTMIDVAVGLQIPSYLFFASPASFLSFMLDVTSLDSQLSRDSVTELRVRGFVNSVPRSVLPTSVLKQGDGYSWYLHHGRRFTETKGIIVNTFTELEPFVLDTLSTSDVPKVYPVGPIMDLNGPAQWHPDRAQQEGITKWLDNQPASSVVFLCFGSMGCLSGPQVKEIALGLERAGFRFLWSLREPPKTRLGLPSEYLNLDDALPSGFLERTARMGLGLVCGWVPQVTILAHRAIGGFVSHCGWNSILESLWYGVPIATWPVYAEQQMNALEMVKELGLAIEIRLDYREGSDLVLAEEVEKGIKGLMISDNEVRAKVKGMKEKSRIALMENGSSYESLGILVEELMANYEKLKATQ